MPKNSARITITTLVNSDKIRTETRNGRELIIVPSYTLPDNVVMNGILYPAEEIANSFGSLERTPAPFDHPTHDGNWISAKDPEALNTSYIGAWNENVRQENGRVAIDKMIDVEYAKATVNGQRVLDAIDKGEPIHTSTGLDADLMKLENSENGAEYSAHNMVFDHDAILLGVDGAATPEQGVGMLVNAAGEGPVIINSVLEDVDENIDWHLSSLIRSMHERENLAKMDSFREAFMSFFAKFKSNQTPEQETATMANENSELLTAINNLATTMNTAMESLANTLTTAVEPLASLNEGLTELVNSSKAAAEAEKAALVNSVVKGGLLNEDVAKTLDVPALKALANASKDKDATNANGTFIPNSNGNEFEGYDLNALADAPKN